ncbi:MAG: tautomerase family protein [Herminiimonas sp.]|nr:tautomerase family protein [Herminiimonas sp.]
MRTLHNTLFEIAIDIHGEKLTANTESTSSTLERKKIYYKAIADGLHARLGMRREDVIINPIEVKKENWSLGNGEAQYA